jgi:hypothetical protein
MESHIPVESLSEDLNQPVPGSAVIHGFAGDELDQIAEYYDTMQWWLSDIGLNMAIVSPATSVPSIPAFDELVGRATLAEPAEARKRPRPGKTNPTVQRIKKKARELRKEGLDYRSICERLGNVDRPPHAAWRQLPWPIAYKKHTSAVTKWLSEACSVSHS